VHNGEALLRQLQLIMCLEALDHAAHPALPGAEFPDVVEQRVETFLVEDYVNLLVSADDLISHDRDLDEWKCQDFVGNFLPVIHDLAPSKSPVA
jgi:hypothetical protein